VIWFVKPFSWSVGIFGGFGISIGGTLGIGGIGGTVGKSVANEFI
jgi:hypothetical protein